MRAEREADSQEERLARVTLAISYALTFVVPLAIQNSQGLFCAGIGTLFEVADRYFIITASHVCDRDLSSLFIPNHGDLDDRIDLALVAVYFTKNHDEVDVGAIEISEIAFYFLKEKVYNFANLNLIDLRGYANPALIIGFPDKNYPENGTGLISPVTVQSHKIAPPSDVKPPPIENLDVFYHYSRSAFRLEGTSWIDASSPALNGISGASVWCMLRPTGRWTPKEHLAITGIEVAFNHGHYARVQSWWAVARLLCIKSPEIAQQFSIKTGVSIDKLS